MIWSRSSPITRLHMFLTRIRGSIVRALVAMTTDVIWKPRKRLPQKLLAKRYGNIRPIELTVAFNLESCWNVERERLCMGAAATLLVMQWLLPLPLRRIHLDLETKTDLSILAKWRIRSTPY